MTCDDLRRIVSGPVENATGAERRGVLNHLPGCAECRRWWATDRPLFDSGVGTRALTLKDAADPELPPLYDPQAILDALNEEKRRL